MRSDEGDRAPPPPVPPDSTKLPSDGVTSPPKSTQTATGHAEEPPGAETPSLPDSALLTQEEMFQLLACVGKP